MVRASWPGHPGLYIYKKNMLKLWLSRYDKSGGCKCESHPNLSEKLGLLNFTEP